MTILSAADTSEDRQPGWHQSFWQPFAHTTPETGAEHPVRIFYDAWQLTKDGKGNAILRERFLLLILAEARTLILADPSSLPGKARRVGRGDASYFLDWLIGKLGYPEGFEEARRKQLHNAMRTGLMIKMARDCLGSGVLILLGDLTASTTYVCLEHKIEDHS